MDRQNRIIGITCSTFDLLHAGHIIMLEECKKYCDYLICAIQVDPTIDRKEKTHRYNHWWKDIYNSMLSDMWIK